MGEYVLARPNPPNSHKVAVIVYPGTAPFTTSGKEIADTFIIDAYLVTYV